MQGSKQKKPYEAKTDGYLSDGGMQSVFPSLVPDLIYFLLMIRYDRVDEKRQSSGNPEVSAQHTRRGVISQQYAQKASQTRLAQIQRLEKELRISQQEIARMATWCVYTHPKRYSKVP